MSRRMLAKAAWSIPPNGRAATRTTASTASVAATLKRPRCTACGCHRWLSSLPPSPSISPPKILSGQRCSNQRPTSRGLQQQPLSCLAVQWEHDSDDDDDNDPSNKKNTADERIENPKHCKTCTCDDHATTPNKPNWLAKCTLNAPSTEPLPPPLPEPKYTFLRRVLNHPATVALDSAQGRHRLLRSLQHGTAHSYFALQNHFCNQSEPAYCGVTTLLIVLNAFCVDPLRRWKGGWRYFGHEDLILENCCLNPERVRRVGIDMTQFAQLASCQGLSVELKRVSFDNDATLAEFRANVKRVLSTSAEHEKDQDADEADTTNLNSLLVVSYARSALGQTGDGHFSPIAAYDDETDSVLVLDVARFKYPSSWVTLEDLYNAMKPVDPATNLSRGWILLEPPQRSTFYQGSNVQDEAMRPVDDVPAMHEENRCPAHSVKVEFCPNQPEKDETAK